MHIDSRIFTTVNSYGHWNILKRNVYVSK